MESCVRVCNVHVFVRVAPMRFAGRGQPLTTPGTTSMERLVCVRVEPSVCVCVCVCMCVCVCVCVCTYGPSPTSHAMWQRTAETVSVPSQARASSLRG